MLSKTVTVSYSACSVHYIQRVHRLEVSPHRGVHML